MKRYDLSDLHLIAKKLKPILKERRQLILEKDRAIRDTLIDVALARIRGTGTLILINEERGAIRNLCKELGVEYKEEGGYQ